jgi:hypothetical protein
MLTTVVFNLFVRVPPDIISLQLCTPKVVGKSKSKAVPLHAMEALGGRGGIAPTHSRPRH